MARPSGHPLSKPAWDDVLRLSGLTVARIAEDSGIPAATLRGLVSGHQNASTDRANQIAHAVKVHTATLFPTVGPQATVAPVEAAA